MSVSICIYMYMYICMCDCMMYMFLAAFVTCRIHDLTFKDGAVNPS